ncbi:MAG: hypothetical protein Q8918_15140 [Bacteroidota bacterium]|nr:hypothetical protein [Bacteroidota bacterium]
MATKIERILKFWGDFLEGRLSEDDEMTLYAWRRLLPKNERAYRNRSSRRKLFIMISHFVDEMIWWEELKKFIQNDEQLKQRLSDMYKDSFNTAS